MHSREPPPASDDFLHQHLFHCAQGSVMLLNLRNQGIEFLLALFSVATSNHDLSSQKSVLESVSGDSFSSFGRSWPGRTSGVSAVGYDSSFRTGLPLPRQRSPCFSC